MKINGGKGVNYRMALINRLRALSFQCDVPLKSPAETCSHAITGESLGSGSIDTTGLSDVLESSKRLFTLTFHRKVEGECLQTVKPPPKNKGRQVPVAWLCFSGSTRRLCCGNVPFTSKSHKMLKI